MTTKPAVNRRLSGIFTQLSHSNKEVGVFRLASFSSPITARKKKEKYDKSDILRQLRKHEELEDEPTEFTNEECTEKTNDESSLIQQVGTDTGSGIMLNKDRGFRLLRTLSANGVRSPGGKEMLRNGPSAETLLTASATKKKMKVRFVGSTSSRQGVHVSVIGRQSSLTRENYSDIYWSSEEIEEMSKRAINFANRTAKNDPYLVECLERSYGLIYVEESANKDGQPAMTSESAMYYFFKYRDVEEQEEEGQISTTVRGLERFLSPKRLGSYSKECVRSVLDLQSRMVEKNQPCLENQQRQAHTLETALRTQSTRVSEPSRRFARLLGKGDAATVGQKNGRRWAAMG